MIQAATLMINFALGMVLAVIGALKLETAKVLGIDDARAGGLVSALMLSSFVMIVVLGPMVDTFGHKPIAVCGFIISSFAILFLVSAATYRTAVAACALLGVGAMCLNSVGNTLMPLVLFAGKNPTAAMNLGTAFFVMGASSAPFIIGLLLSKSGYRRTGMLIAALLFLPVVFAAMAPYPRMQSEFTFYQVFSLLRSGVVISVGSMLFCYLGVEMSMGLWITSYLKESRYSEKRASMILSTFWISLVVLRLAVTTFITPETGLVVVQFFGLLAAIGIGGMICGRTKFIAAASVVCTGLALGPIFPTTVSIAFARIPASFHGSAFSIAFALALLGGSSIPAVIGLVSRKMSIRRAFVVPLGSVLTLCLIVLVMLRS